MAARYKNKAYFYKNSDEIFKHLYILSVNIFLLFSFRQEFVK